MGLNSKGEGLWLADSILLIWVFLKRRKYAT